MLGEFGDVYKGTLQRPLEEEITVAIKTLRVFFIFNNKILKFLLHYKFC